MTKGIINESTIEIIAQVTSANVSKIFGLYPRKGIIAVGSDADLTVVDPELKIITPDIFTRASDYSIYNGRSLKGWPVMTISRGEIIAEEGKVVADSGRGLYLKRN